MPAASSVFVASVLVVVPSVGVYYWATSSSVTVTEIEDNKQEPPEAVEAPKPRKLVKQKRVFNPNATWASGVRDKLKNIASSFSYDKMDKYSDKQGKAEAFTEENDKLREELKEPIRELLNRDETQGRDWADILEEDLGLTLINDSTYDVWLRLAQIRAREAKAQIDMDSEFATPDRDEDLSHVSSQHIFDFCHNPSPAYSHLGLTSEERISREESREYRFFTYFSYCSKESHYLNEKVNFGGLDN